MWVRWSRDDDSASCMVVRLSVRSAGCRAGWPGNQANHRRCRVRLSSHEPVRQPVSGAWFPRLAARRDRNLRPTTWSARCDIYLFFNYKNRTHIIYNNNNNCAIEILLLTYLLSCAPNGSGTTFTAMLTLLRNKRMLMSISVKHSNQRLTKRQFA